MLKFKSILIISFISVIAVAQNITSEKGKSIIYFNKDHFLIEGTTIPESLKENTYDRLPLSFKDKVRTPVWNLSKSSAGISVRFLSNSGTIKVRWELLNNTTMNHMAETGVKGIDLYCKTDDHWQYVNTARPTGKVNDVQLITNLSSEMREYKMFLPLYDGVIKLEIGIDSMSRIEKPARMKTKPIVFYGTSITQGGCASRPGMVYSGIISRKLDVECINFGFSGNGRMETPVVEVISEIDASIYVIDCVSNMSAAEIHSNSIPLVELIRTKHPDTPIIFVEGTMFEKAFFDETIKNDINEKNMAQRSEFEKMIKRGYSNIFYVDNNGALGNDHEGTVDSVHLTDLGFMRFADFLISKFEQLNLTNTILKTP